MGGRHDADLRIADLASARHGVVSRAELLALGLGEKAIEYRTRTGRLHRRYRGVYAVGHTALTREGRWRAAVLAVGDAAALSHADAAALWGLMPSRGARVDVTTPRRTGRAMPKGIRLHRVGSLTDREVTEREAIPVTTPMRTLLDLARTLDGRQMEAVIAQADRLELFDLVELRAILAAHPRWPGSPSLTALLDRLAGVGTADTRSPPEIAMLQLCDDYNLPTPRANTVPDGFTFAVDFRWPGTTLIVETDGYQFHRMPTVFESDRDRDQALTLAGYTVVRFTKRQIERTPTRTAQRLRQLIKRCGASDPP